MLSSSKTRISSLLLLSWWCMQGSTVLLQAIWSTTGLVVPRSRSVARTSLLVHAFSTTTTATGTTTYYRTAFATTSTSAFSSTARRRAERLILSISSRSSSSSSSSDDDDDDTTVNGEGFPKDDSSNRSKPRRQLEGKTGWTHSTPSASSGFWGDSASKRQQEEEHDNQGEGEDEQQLPTGWLHNTKSPSEQKAKQQQHNTPTTTSAARRRLQLAMKQQERNHRMIAPPAFHSTGTATMVTTEHALSVPLVRGDGETSKQRIDVFFSIVEKQKDDDTAWWKSLAAQSSPPNRAAAYVAKQALVNADNLVLYLQGGPGFGAPTPVVGLGVSKDASWAAAALDDARYSKVVLMDQRGTGRSTPITKQTLEIKFPNLFLLDNDHEPAATLESLASTKSDEVSLVQSAIAETTSYLANFRADNIVQDAEEIRDALLMPLLDGDQNEKADNNNKPRPWGCTLGQSFGGFCLMTYLSQVAHPPKICLFTGGIAPMLTPQDEVYASLWDRVKERSVQYYEMYPGDVAVVKRIVRKLLEAPPTLPSGGTLTARRFLQLGLGMGGSPSNFASLHALFASALVVPSSTAAAAGDGDTAEFSRAFLKRIDSEQSFDDHPIYFWLHESIYGDGTQNNSPTNWSAHRMYEQKKALPDSDFDYTLTSQMMDNDARPTLFFGEMVFPWMAEDYAELSGLGLQAVAEALAAKTDWGPLYNGNAMKKALGDEGGCRAAAAVYYDDLYVDFDACAKVFARNGPLGKCKVWINNEYQHSGLRDGGAKIFSKLHGMATGSIRTPS